MYYVENDICRSYFHEFLIFCSMGPVRLTSCHWKVERPNLRSRTPDKETKMKSCDWLGAWQTCLLEIITPALLKTVASQAKE